MSNDMVERVAMALFLRDQRRWGTANDQGYTWADVLEAPAALEPYTSEARAAIEAMRNPTEEMLAAAFDCEQRAELDPTPGTWATYSDVWNAMIAAALKGLERG